MQIVSTEIKSGVFYDGTESHISVVVLAPNSITLITSKEHVLTHRAHTSLIHTQCRGLTPELRPVKKQAGL